MKRLNDLKAEQEKSKQVLKKLFNPATLKAQSQKWTEHEAKNAKMMQEYKRQISFRADTLPTPKISYVVNFKKEATIKITRGDNPLNLVVHPNFRLKTLGSSEWLVINQAKRLGLSPPPELVTFGLTAEEKKRKMTELIKEVFVTKNVRVDGMDRNLIPPPMIMQIQGLVINEPEVINQAKRLGLSPPPELVTFGLTAEEKKRKRTELIKEVFVTENVRVDRMDRNLIPPPRIMPIQEIAMEMFSKMNYVIEAMSDCIKAREIVEKNLDNVGQKIFVFIKNYQSMNAPHLLVRYNVLQYDDHIDGYISILDEYVSIIANDTFPQHMSPITVPLSVQTLERARISRKSVSVLLEPRIRLGTGWVGFGVCPETCDPKLVKIDKVKGILEVHVYTLSTRAWKKVSVKSQYKSCRLMYHKGVCVNGFIYWIERDDRPPPFRNESYSIVSFNLSNDEFGKVCLPRSLQLSQCLELSKWNECLTVIDHAHADIYDHSLNIWVMKDDGVAQSFTIMLHIEPMFSKYYEVFELRKNGEAIIETRCANNVDDPILQVYDPCSGHVNDIRIPWSGHDDIGKTDSFFSISSYMETLLLLDQ
uniref:F-box associated beta-propeller type 1 domain-containing protein n=1 Tax=Tanacetum cinerariifolium TaxID=118510 RepID=A0A6L2MNW0_TANCI|nr:hypothetical protein [Tanacetum cinerariifolium]